MCNIYKIYVNNELHGTYYSDFVAYNNLVSLREKYSKENVRIEATSNDIKSTNTENLLENACFKYDKIGRCDTNEW